jgi:tetratricopeptide (TPR) repeat protein
LRLSAKYIILSILVACIIVISATFYIGSNNNAISKNDFESYTNAAQLIKAKQTENALMSLVELDNKYPENVFIMRLLGYAYTSSGNFKLGSSYFEKGLELNPMFQLDFYFMLQYGETLYYNGEYEKSRVVLEKCLELQHPKTYEKKINSFLLKISQKGENKGGK